MPPKTKQGFLVQLIVLLCTLMCSSQVFSQSSPGELVDVAGRQRMLSQRIVKAYAQAAQDIHRDPSMAQLKASIDLFEKQLRILKSQAPNDKVRGDLTKVESLWKPFSATARGPLSREGAAQLLQGGEPLLQACQAVVTQLESTYGVSQAKIVNLSGRQRMLSQRITKAYMFLNWGFKDESLNKELDEARKDFEAALETLRTYPQNTPEINAGLVEVGREWEVFRKGFNMREKSGEFVPFFIATAGDHILVTMDKVTGMYARLGKQSPKP